MDASFNSFHYHVVDVDFQVLPYLMGEHIVHESLVDGANILKVEGHDI